MNKQSKTDLPTKSNSLTPKQPTSLALDCRSIPPTTYHYPARREKNVYRTGNRQSGGKKPDRRVWAAKACRGRWIKLRKKYIYVYISTPLGRWTDKLMAARFATSLVAWVEEGHVLLLRTSGKSGGKQFGSSVSGVCWC